MIAPLSSVGLLCFAVSVAVGRVVTGMRHSWLFSKITSHSLSEAEKLTWDWLVLCEFQGQAISPGLS